MCPSAITESARSIPAVSAETAGDSRANRPNAPSTWSHAPCSPQRSARRSSGSKSPVFTSPALPITIAGAPSSARNPAARPSTSTTWTESRPIPSIDSAFRALACTYSLENTGTAGSPPKPCSSTSTPCRSAHQRRPAARPTKFAIVAPVVSVPLQSAGSSNRSRSHRIATSSSSAPYGELTAENEFWSSSDVSQSAPSAAGVVPPVTKWKNRGPEERVATSAAPTSSARAARAPSPSSGSAPPNRSPRAGSTGESSSSAR